VRTLPSCGTEKDVPDSPLLTSIVVASVSTGTTFAPICVYNTITDEERKLPVVLLSHWGDKV